MLTDAQHMELKAKLRMAFEADTSRERRFALEDAAKIAGVAFTREFVTAGGMKPTKQVG